MSPKPVTPDPELNTVLYELVTGVRAVLGDNFIAAYLQGSFALGDWDQDSDVDFLVAIQHDVSEADVVALQSMHSRIYNLECSWAQHLEGSYFPKEILKCADPTRAPLVYLDNAHEYLIRSQHDNTLVVRWVVREYGIALAGPAPQALIEPISADDLRREVLTTMLDWAEKIFADPEQMNNRWYQPYAILSYCRMLHTLQTGRVGSKPAGAQWAQNTLEPRWAGLIRRAWEERPHPSLKVQQPADPDDFARTLEFIQYALTASSKFWNN